MSLRNDPLIARDYNRGLSAVALWASSIVGTLRAFTRPLERLAAPLWNGSGDNNRGWWARPLLLGFTTAAALLPFDQFISDSMAQFRRGGSHAFGGDIQLTITTLGQFGDAATSIIVAWAVFLVWPGRRARLWDWAACVAVAVILANIAKMLIGRHRPSGGDSWNFSGPLGSVATDNGPVYAWEFWKNRAADLGSTPSSHTIAAVVLAMVLTRLEPKLRPLVFTCAAFVGFNRVLSGYHYPSDVVLGWTLGVLVVRWIWDGRMVERLQWAVTQRGKPPQPIGSRVGKLPALANAVVVQRGEEAHPEQQPQEPPAGH